MNDPETKHLMRELIASVYYLANVVELTTANSVKFAMRSDDGPPLAELNTLRDGAVEDMDAMSQYLTDYISDIPPFPLRPPPRPPVQKFEFDTKAALSRIETAEEPAPDTFFARYLRGELVEADIDDYISLWHKSMGMTPLHEYLGMTWEQYSAWVQNSHLLADPEPPHDNRAEHADRIEALREPLDVMRYGGIPCEDIV